MLFIANAKNIEDVFSAVPVTFTVILKNPVSFIRILSGSTDMILKFIVGSSTVTDPPNVDEYQVYGLSSVVKVYVSLVQLLPSVAFTYQVYSVEYDNEMMFADLEPFDCPERSTFVKNEPSMV